MMTQFVTRHGWNAGLFALLVALLVTARILQPGFGAGEIVSLSRASLPYVFATVAMAVVVIAGGIDLSIASIMAVCSASVAVLMPEHGPVVAVALTLAIGIAIGATNGILIVLTRVPDIVATLAMLFVWEGVALLILEAPGGSLTPSYRAIIQGGMPFFDWVPRALFVMGLLLFAIWFPIRKSRLGLSIYATGSDETAAFRSGVSVTQSRIIAYAIAGLFAAFGGLSLSMLTGLGEPLPGPYLLSSVAAVVLGGVVLGGGRGGLLGPVIAVFVLRLIRLILTLLAVDPNITTIVEGAVMIGVVVFGTAIVARGARR